MNRTLAGRHKERQREWIEAFWASQSEALELILNGLSLSQVLERIASRLEEAFEDGALCSIFLSNPEGTLLRFATAPSLPDDFCVAVAEIPVRESAGACGTAAALRRMVAIDDIPSHPDWASVRDYALRHDLRACWSVPVIGGDGALLGTVGIYYREHRRPDADERARLESAAKLVAVAIQHGRAAERMRTDETLLRIAGQNARLGGWTVDLPQGPINWSPEVCAIHEVPSGYRPGWREAFDYYVPEARPVVFEAFMRCAEEGLPQAVCELGAAHLPPRKSALPSSTPLCRRML